MKLLSGTRRSRTGKKIFDVFDAVSFRRRGRSAALFLLLFAAIALAAPAVSSAYVAVGVSVTIAPPAIPIYAQPVCPGPGYIWTPGYWAWDPVYGYYWVPGTWVIAPFPGALWTPGYWGWVNGVYIWHTGYWGPVVGFYGGINYGYGYTGYGYWGGYWRGRTFYYNRAANNVNIRRVTTVYRSPVSRFTVSRAGYNGPGGIRVRETAAQRSWARQRRFSAVSVQRQHERSARSYPGLRASVNHGRPSIAATSRPGMFTGRGVVRGSRPGGPYRAAPQRRGTGPGYRPSPGYRPAPQRREAAPRSYGPPERRGYAPQRGAPGGGYIERGGPGGQPGGGGYYRGGGGGGGRGPARGGRERDDGGGR